MKEALTFEQQPGILHSSLSTTSTNNRTEASLLLHRRLFCPICTNSFTISSILYTFKTMLSDAMKHFVTHTTSDPPLSNDFRCRGYAYSTKTQACQNPILAANRLCVIRGLDRLSTERVTKDELKDELSYLASLSLCKRWHRGQAEELAAYWRASLRWKVVRQDTQSPHATTSSTTRCASGSTPATARVATTSRSSNRDSAASYTAQGRHRTQADDSVTSASEAARTPRVDGFEPSTPPRNHATSYGLLTPPSSSSRSRSAQHAGPQAQSPSPARPTPARLVVHDQRTTEVSQIHSSPSNVAMTVDVTMPLPANHSAMEQTTSPTTQATVMISETSSMISETTTMLSEINVRFSEATNMTFGATLPVVEAAVRTHRSGSVENASAATQEGSRTSRDNAATPSQSNTSSPSLTPDSRQHDHEVLNVVPRSRDVQAVIEFSEATSMMFGVASTGSRVAANMGNEPPITTPEVSAATSSPLEQTQEDVAPQLTSIVAADANDTQVDEPQFVAGSDPITAAPSDSSSGEVSVEPHGPLPPPLLPCTHSVCRRPLPAVDAECLICQDTLNLTDPMVWCKSGCGVNMHRSCFDSWVASRVEDDETSTLRCCHCRQAWDATACACDEQPPEMEEEERPVVVVEDVLGREWVIG